MNEPKTLNTDSLLEIAIKLLRTKKKPKKLKEIIKETMQKKGYTMEEAKDMIPQFILDFQTSGFFVYLGDDEWDLKDRQSIDKLDKIEKDNVIEEEENEEVKENELKDEEDTEESNLDEEDDDDEDEDDDDEKDEEDELVEALKSNRMARELDDDEYDEEEDFHEYDEENGLE